MSGDKQFERLVAEAAAAQPSRAPASLKARIFTALIREQQASGPLAPLAESEKAGRGLCVFEQLVTIAPAGERLQPVFYCSVCHARVLAERFDNPPIFWEFCPYASFKKD